MGRGRPSTPVVLTGDERQALTSLAHLSRTALQLAQRARIILACAAGRPPAGIAERLRLSPTTVCKWRTRFLAGRLDGLTDEPRPGTLRRITDAQVASEVCRVHRLPHEGRCAVSIVASIPRRRSLGTDCQLDAHLSP